MLVGAARGWVRALLLLYPRVFRQRFAADMLDDFDERLQEHAARGVIAVILLVAKTTVDVAVAALHEWLRPSVPRGALSRNDNRTSSTRGHPMDHLKLDLRFALRSLARRPGFTAIAVLTLALGIGANSMVFALMDAVLLRAPAVQSPETLAAVYTTSRTGDPRSASSYPDYLDYRDRTMAFDDLAGYREAEVTLGDATAAEVVTAELVTGNYFDVVGVPAARGRTLSPADDESGDAQVMVLSHATWRSRFGGDPDIIGRTIRLNDASFTVIGVADASFRGLRLGAAPALWVPLHSFSTLNPSVASDLFESRGSRWIQGLIARLGEGVSIERARAELLRVSDELAEEDPDARGPRTVTVDPLPSYVLPAGDEQVIASFVWILQGVVGFTLLLACANLANLLLAKGLSRRREIGVRMAIGAGRRRLIGQLLVEALMLSVLAAAAGLTLAALALSLMGSFELPFGVDVAALRAGINAKVFVFAGIVVVLTTAAFGIVPALHGTRGDLVGALREATSTGGRRTHRLLGSLVSVQVALCIVLLTGAGLFLRTLRSQLETDLGFRPGGVALMVIDPSMNGYSGSATTALVDRLLSRISALPGVEAVSAGLRVPVRPSGLSRSVEVEGYTPAPGEEMSVDYNYVAPDYFRALGIPIMRGREFTDADGPDAQRVLVINEAMAQAWWPDRDPIGGTVIFRDEPHTVVGIAGNAAWSGLEISRTPYAYGVLPQFGIPITLNIVARTAPGREEALLPMLRTTLRDEDPSIGIVDLASMRGEVSTTLAPQRAGATLLSGFAALALLLASVGISGVVAFAVAQRRREFAVRLALGAPVRRIVLLLIRGMGTPVAYGTAVGLAAAIALGPTMGSLIVGVEPADPLTLVSTVVVLSIAAVLATMAPARRAARTDPMEAMRAD